ncbi:uncharacterized protein LOC113225182 [Piliocolobus tephrosceles]|uniref:uncharacterized protein LOC113225182 n=1 Tax=Piliocolobus tephrosceles TaxID=591936 RepID=UPI000E6B1643|nr:uncharacterized protein LOC113225182 [Piliocolobus tephrosceles]
MSPLDCRFHSSCSSHDFRLELPVTRRDGSTASAVVNGSLFQPPVSLMETQGGRKKQKEILEPKSTSAMKTGFSLIMNSKIKSLLQTSKALCILFGGEIEPFKCAIGGGDSAA